MYANVDMDLEPAEEIFERFDQDMLRVIGPSPAREVLYRGYRPRGRFTFGFFEVELVCRFNVQEESNPVSCSVIDHDYSLPRKVIDGIRHLLRTTLGNELDFFFRKTMSAIEIAAVVLRLVEETGAYLQENLQIAQHLEPSQFLDALGVEIPSSATSCWEISGSRDKMTAMKLLGKSPDELCRAALLEYKLLHCENVLRNDLAKRFLVYQRGLRQRLEQLSVGVLRKHVLFEHRGSSSSAAGKEQLID